MRVDSCHSQACTLQVNLCDFDDVSYQIVVDKADMGLMKLSMNMPCYQHFEDKGGKDALTKGFGDFVTSPEIGYDITLAIPLQDSKVKGSTELVKKLSLIKSTVLGGAFDYFFDALLQEKPKTEKFKFDLRGDTTLYFMPRDDRVTVIFAVDFFDRVDNTIAKVFLQEFVDSRRKIGRAPPTSWGTAPPTELHEWGITENQGNLGYISFAVLKNHVTGPGKKERVISILQSFRTFLQYHIKMSKSHFHSKMRHRVRELLKIKNRAQVHDEKKEKKTVGGKTFKRSN